MAVAVAACGPDDTMGDARPDAPDVGPDASMDAPDAPRACPEACPPCNICLDGECIPVPDGRGCANGTCRQGMCCTGCWDGARCQVGLRQDACGLAGAMCHDCSCDGDACDTGECIPTRPADAVSAGNVSSCAHTTDGRIFCWGSAERGTVGHGAFEPLVASPVDVFGGAAVAVGGAHACAIDDAGGVSCWGANDCGQLGTGDVGTDQNAPTAVPGLTGVTSLSLGTDFSCAIDAAGKLRCWGAGDSGQLGVGGASDLPTPTSVNADEQWIVVGAGDRHACAINEGQLLYCWGANEAGQLGLGERGITTGRTSPTLVTDATLFATTTSGAFHGCARSVLNVLWCWGDNSMAQLGTGDRADRRLPGVVGDGLERPSAGAVHGCAVRNVGTLACWGVGQDGRLGLGDDSDRLSPTLLDTRRTWAEVSAGERHSCAVDDAGAVYCWGSGADGQLGVPDVARALRPIRTCLPAL